MKKSFVLWNKDSVDNRKILKDLADLSDGKIVRDEEALKLADVADLIDLSVRNTNAGNKKNKKNHSRKG